MRILVGIDERNDAAELLAQLRPLVAASDASVTLLNVVNPLTDCGDVVASSMADALTKVIAARTARLHSIARANALPNAEVVVEPLERGEDTDACIRRVGDRDGADLIAVASRRAGTTLGLILGSVADALVHHAHRPIMVIRTGDPNEATPGPV